MRPAAGSGRSRCSTNDVAEGVVQLNIVGPVAVWALAGWLAYNFSTALKRKVIRLRGGVLIERRRRPAYFALVLIVWATMILGLTTIGLFLLYR